ncbi:MAG: SDR family NAD(P)-dependent oxidoreductase [Thermoflexibacter sp.]
MMQGQVIWITGASSGIGEALAYSLARKGAKLILSARREEELFRVKSACQRADGDILVLPLDLEKQAEFPEKVAQAIAHFAHIDILINNGGISQRSLAKDTDLAVDRRIMEIDYFGTLALTKAVLPLMLQRKSGKIVVITSLVGKFGTPLRSAYAAAKHALHGFFDSLRAECWRENLKVLIVCPGFIKTQVSINALTAKGDKQNKMDDAQAKGMSAEKCAEKIIKAILADREEVYIGGREIYAVYLKRLFPQLFSRILRKAKVT